MSDTRKVRPSIYDVAARAGVSHMTVSRVLNGHPNIKASTRQKVEGAIADLNYAPSSIARALATNRSMRIGVLIEGSRQFGPNSALRALEVAAREHGYSVSSLSVDDTAVISLDERIRELVAQGVDAVCMIAPRASSVDSLRERMGVPVVVVTAQPGARTVAVDQRSGANAAMAYLASLGHERVLHISGPLDWLDARAREEAWRESLTARGIDADPLLIEGDWTSDFGYTVGLEDPRINDVSAVFAANDQMALGLVHGLRVRGLRVPEDISVIGFDDNPEARHYEPPLTTVRQDFGALGTAVMGAVLAEIEGNPAPEPPAIVPELIVRDSARAAQ